MNAGDLELLRQLHVPHETIDRLKSFVQILDEASAGQNLISAGTRPQLWQRHILDSLQLLPLAEGTGSWLDVGTGAGFPGLVIAIAEPNRQMILAEPRALRVGFLREVASKLHLDNVAVHQKKVQLIASPPVSVISARAVAPLTNLIESTTHLADEQTLWLLMKGRSARSELEQARATWQGEFRLVPSLTDPDAAIVVASGLKRRVKR
ncbi:16S rRNA (guanine(527)-N(7))-methyltransferase RsmG [Sphingomonas jatrophae]|uniref:16S rRNA (guanine(527)-N(7))-methyltransferase RsmG n=1 Tax=Sphingomonas jatrophae TaxID=1166337 RepID=UPI000B852897|nr:16S rRNA (guanine(527)-N(7))-methyltransferase RsmG [Sphingomonas jatrophae]